MKKALNALLAFLTSLNIGLGDQLAFKNNEANLKVEEEQYSEALKGYRDAQIESPTNSTLNYNIGTVYLKQDKFDEAVADFQMALVNAKDAELEAATYYNMGNAYFENGKWVQAIQAYKNCLELTPEDMDAKYNLEYARKKLKEEVEKQQQNQQQQQQQQSQQQQQQGEKDQQDKEQQEQQMAQAQEQKDKEEQQDQQAQPEEEKEMLMSEEEARRLLEAIEKEEKDIQKKLRERPFSGKQRPKK